MQLDEDSWIFSITYATREPERGKLGLDESGEVDGVDGRAVS
jgi:hypothetical protein